MASHLQLRAADELEADLEEDAVAPPPRRLRLRLALGLAAGAALLAAAGAALLAVPGAPATRHAASKADLASAIVEEGREGHEDRRKARYHELRERCHDCTPAWDEEDVNHACDNRGPSVMRRLSGDDVPQARSSVDDLGMAKRFPIGKHKGQMMYYGSQDLNDQRIAAESITVIVHGAGRNSQDYFCTLRKLVEETTIFDAATLILAPKFSERKKDKVESMDCVWNGSNPDGDWRVGGETDDDSPCRMSSFELFDTILKLANDRYKFPFLKHVRFMGFSAGGQTVHRYSLVSHLPPPQLSSKEMAEMGAGPDPDLKVSFIIGNPSTYTYLDKHRWSYDCRSFDDDDEKAEEFVDYSKSGQRVLSDSEGCFNYTYKLYDVSQGRTNWFYGGQKFKNLGPRSEERPFICADGDFNDWGYGLSTDEFSTPDGFEPFLKKHPNLRQGIREWYPKRKVTFLIGGKDTCTQDTFQFCFGSCWRKNDLKSPCHPTLLDIKCPAMLQGPNRKQRAIHYLKHLEQFYGKRTHKLYLVPSAGHQAEEEFLSAMQGFASKTLQQLL